MSFDGITRRGRERAREMWSGHDPAKCSTEEIAQAAAAGYETDRDGERLVFVGRDPRRIEPGELAAMGHERLSPMQAIRAKCLDCCAGSAREVRLCVAVACPSWPFRTGHNPWRAPPSEAQREAGRRALAANRAAGASDAGSRRDFVEETAPEVSEYRPAKEAAE